jgi:hypothetical protein
MLIGQKIEKTSDVLIFFKSDTHNPKVVVQHFNGHNCILRYFYIYFSEATQIQTSKYDLQICNSNNPLTKKFKTKKAKEIKIKTD